MDALSHSLIAGILFSAAGLTPLLPFAVLGAVIPDADIFFSIISDRDPSLCLFTHGGITHSFAGAFVLSFLSYGVILIIALEGIISFPLVAGNQVFGFAAILAGTLLHLASDVLACPGIPLLAPLADRKYTLGLLPGPSILLAFSAFGLLFVTVTRLLEFSVASAIYAAVVVLYLAVRGVFFLYAHTRIKGRRVPKVNPFSWLTISEDGEYCTVQEHSLLHGIIDEAVFSRYKCTSQGEVEGTLRLPEVRRLFFHSYCVIAERTGSVLTLSDPVREKGYLYYPPHYKRVDIPMRDQP